MPTEPSWGQLKYQHSCLEFSQQCSSQEQHRCAQPGIHLRCALLSPTGCRGAHSSRSRASLLSHHLDPMKIHTLAGNHCKGNIFIFLFLNQRSSATLAHWSGYGKVREVLFFAHLTSRLIEGRVGKAIQQMSKHSCSATVRNFPFQLAREESLPMAPRTGEWVYLCLLPWSLQIFIYLHRLCSSV